MKKSEFRKLIKTVIKEEVEKLNEFNPKVTTADLKAFDKSFLELKKSINNIKNKENIASTFLGNMKDINKRRL